MKKTRFLLAIAAMITACAIISCEKVTPDTEDPDEKPEVEQPEEKPEEEPEAGYPEAVNANTYVINGTEYTFQSTALMSVGENLTIAASPAEGHSDVVSIMTSDDEYFFAGLNPLLIGKETDLMTETSTFTIYSTLADALIEELTVETVASEISKGVCSAQYAEGKFTFKAGMILQDGTTLAVNIVAEEKEDDEIEINENEYAKGDDLKPVRAAFYMKEGGLTYLYFTPGAITYFTELEIATSYMFLVVPDELVNGEEIELSDITAEQPFMFGYIHNGSGEYVEVTNENLDAAEGIFCIENPEEGIYAATFEFIIEDEIYYVYYDGECTSATIEAPEEEDENYFACGDEEASIVGAGLTKGEELWTLSLNLDNGRTAEVTMPAKFWDAETYEVIGFSYDNKISVSYNGTVWCKENGSSGTIAPLLDEEVGIIEIEFTNYEDCEFYYCGSYTTK